MTMTIVVTPCSDAPLRLRFDHRRGSDAMSSLAVDRSPTVAMHDVSRPRLSVGWCSGRLAWCNRRPLELGQHPAA